MADEKTTDPVAGAEPDEVKVRAGGAQEEATSNDRVDSAPEQTGAVSSELTDPEDESLKALPVPPTEGSGKSGRGLAAVALFFGLLAIGGMGYLYFELVYKNPVAILAGGLQKQAEALDKVADDINAALMSNRQGQEAALDEALAAQATHLAEIEARTTRTLQEALEAAPPSQKEWKLAEAEYLLRIANHRVRMEQDSEGALTLLMAADEILEELDDFALHPVRARLADEKLALKQVPTDNLQSIYLRLEALKSQTAHLSPILPQFRAPSEEPDAAQTVWQQLATATKDLVRVRTLTDNASVQPLVAPDEEVFLKQQLQLSLLQAQLGVLKRQQDVYEIALTNTRRYLDDYMEVNQHDAWVAELNALLALQLDRPLPDLSGSLNELLSAMGEP